MRLSLSVSVLVFSAMTVVFGGELTYEQLIGMETVPRKVTFKQVGDKSLQLHIYAPTEHKKDDKRPAILVIPTGGSGRIIFSKSMYGELAWPCPMLSPIAIKPKLCSTW